ncbi:DUF2829 domain-containing protein [Xenorhabdus hominickii]|uniref:DUF2829 domain-containing protein n=1 Tax=Xenorhabdus hominickii TaxID=351679 RepID=A0A2G0Q740_XENHO|nr:DUF2829 domain-containing protein [Xenorhabdus hominickii]AOM39227.1 hypothetical protein A9255_00505 [Xenorhabdus hominickii]PHM55032.1 hypothetical protein Xhom_03004 [Xenorhabdus hominickii]
MSDVINPEHECPFNRDDYKGDQIIAPVGSFWWALVQLKLGNKVRRSGWPKEEQLNFVPRRAVTEGNYDYLSHIDKRNIYGNWAPWQPTQEDLMACDWVQVKDFIKPEPETGNNTLVFDLTSDTFTIASMPQFPHFYGYTDTIVGYPNIPVTLGSLSVTQNTTAIDKIMNVMWEEPKDTQSSLEPLELYWYVQETPTVANSADKVGELFKKPLHITVEGVTYNLGVPEVSSNKPDGYRFKYVYKVGSELRAEAQKFSALLKQTGQTKRFYCNWR